MTLCDPRAALAEQSSFLGYLMGLVSVARTIRALGDTAVEPRPARPADDFVHALLGLAALGTAIEGVVPTDPEPPGTVSSPEIPARWLR
ncbi:hypothetical protein FR943_13370 [Mycobacterium sp. TNTM28]|uniref:Uncharacterized protein n=1 Tax=[Mycobacterium] fortunisiensis TaxID=2600579 RepID=A0ABS6KNH1_9MYCO|nr:hypothetical protein [[Mycobacterium] fortunisiensis]MBU9764826.1 hypothetical protein [[Mycobacterium] fortunisiensis]